MTVNVQEIRQVILGVCNRLVDEMTPESRLSFTQAVDPTQVDLPFDSLGLVTLIVDLEEAINEKFGIQLALAHEDVIAQETNPFSSIATLADYISLLMSKQPTTV